MIPTSFQGDDHGAPSPARSFVWSEGALNPFGGVLRPEDRIHIPSGYKALPVEGGEPGESNNNMTRNTRGSEIQKHTCHLLRLIYRLRKVKETP